MALPTIQLSSKRDQVVEALREAILSGQFSPGERLVESRVARQLGTSQTPVREALALLERQGLVVKIANRGTFVSRLHGRELRDLFTLRAEIDALAARLAAGRATDEDVAGLRAILARMHQAEVAGDHAALTDAHLQLHESIYQLSGHTLLTEIFALVQSRMTLALAFAENLFWSEGLETECHVPLIDALAAHDGERAARVARDLALGWIDQVVVENETGR
jgi:DNA-binding GntR family transcriptional regulator